MKHLLRVRWLRHQRGATSTEYALLISLIAMMIFAAVGTFGIAVGDLFEIPPGTLLP